jgi:hypothetical protein
MSTTEFCAQLLDETRHEIDRADAKASILLAGSGVAAGALVAGMASGDLDPTHARGLVQFACLVALALVIVGIIFLGTAVYPRIQGAAIGRARYFMDHAQYETVRDLRTAISKEAADPEGRHVQQLLHLSKIARRKYRCTRWGEVMVGAGLLTATGAAFLHVAVHS